MIKTAKICKYFFFVFCIKKELSPTNRAVTIQSLEEEGALYSFRTLTCIPACDKFSFHSAHTVDERSLRKEGSEASYLPWRKLVIFDCKIKIFCKIFVFCIKKPYFPLPGESIAREPPQIVFWGFQL